MTESARLGMPEDLPIVLDIVERHAATLPDKRGGAMLLADDELQGPINARFARSIGDDDAALIVGVFDEVVFGVAEVRVVRFDEQRAVARLDYFLVDPEAREVAVGESMMNAAVEWAQSHGCSGIESRALPGDRETKNFFESFGLKARLLTVHRAFD